MKNSQIKILTKGIINGNIGKSMLILCLFISFVIFFTALPYLVGVFVSDPIVSLLILSVVLVLNCFAYSAFRSGSCAWFQFHDRQNKAARTFFWFSPKRCVKSTGLYTSLFFRKLMWTVILLLPGAFTAISFVLLALDTGIEFNLFLCGIIASGVMMLLGLLFRFFIVQKYFLAQYLLVSDPKMKVRNAIKMSCEIMNGRLKKTALFKLSFIPWFALCAAIFPTVYVWPYYKQSCVLYSKELTK